MEAALLLGERDYSGAVAITGQVGIPFTFTACKPVLGKEQRFWLKQREGNGAAAGAASKVPAARRFLWQLASAGRQGAVHL